MISLALWKNAVPGKIHLICVFCIRSATRFQAEWVKCQSDAGSDVYTFLLGGLCRILQQQLQLAGQVLALKQQTPHQALAELIDQNTSTSLHAAHMRESTKIRQIEAVTTQISPILNSFT